MAAFPRLVIATTPLLDGKFVSVCFPPVADISSGLQADPMGTKFSAEDACAYEALDRLLFRQWDPIGVSDMEGSADDEYRAYLPEFWRLVRSGSTETQIAEYLSEIERDRIEFETSDEHRLDIARKAIALVATWRLAVRR